MSFENSGRRSRRDPPGEAAASEAIKRSDGPEFKDQARDVSLREPPVARRPIERSAAAKRSDGPEFKDQARDASLREPPVARRSKEQLAWMPQQDDLPDYKDQIRTNNRNTSDATPRPRPTPPPQTSSVATRSPTSIVPNSEVHIARATLVRSTTEPEPQTLIHATPAFNDFRRLLMVTTIFCVVSAVGISLAVVLTQNRDSGGSTNAATRPSPTAGSGSSTPIPTMSKIATQTVAPSSSLPVEQATLGPSFQPTPDPQNERENAFRQCAIDMAGPNGTALVNDPATPQFRALEYFLSGPGKDFEVSNTILFGLCISGCQSGASRSSICIVYPMIVLREALVADSNLNERLSSWYDTSRPLRYSNDLCDQWYGVECVPQPLAVNYPLKLLLSGVNLSGSIPAELARLSTLRMIDLTFNDGLVGNLPYQIGTFPELESLKLHNTGLSGTLPLEIGSLNTLESLDISFTNMNGTIPLQFGGLDRLQEFIFYNTDITGTVPEQVCQLRTANLTSLISDCVANEIECACCTRCCHINGTVPICCAAGDVDTC